MDGSQAREAGFALEGVGLPTVLTTVRTRDEKMGPSTPSWSCVHGPNASVNTSGPSVERIGVSSESVTVRESSGRGVLGCDNTPGPRDESRRWCGSAYGVLHSGRLRDPRLSISCSTTSGRPMGFVWIEPARQAAYVVVAQPGYAEVYEVAGTLPVRVATSTDVELEGSRATFDVREHSGDGRLLRAYRLDAVVAG